MRLADLVELVDDPLELHLVQERHLRGRDRVDLRELLRHLHRQTLACTGSSSLRTIRRPIVSPSSRSITNASRPSRSAM